MGSAGVSKLNAKFANSKIQNLLVLTFQIRYLVASKSNNTIPEIANSEIQNIVALVFQK